MSGVTDEFGDEPEPAVLTAAREAYVARPVPAPPGLVESAMNTVITELRAAHRLPLPGGGVATDLAVANAIRLTLDGDRAVVARGCRVDPEPGAAGRWRVRLGVAISYAHFGRHGDDLVRTRVVDAVDRLFGTTVAGVDIDVVDVFVDSPGEEQ